MADHDSLVQHFSAVSGVDADRAKFYLEAAAWDLPVSVIEKKILVTAIMTYSKYAS